MTKALRLFFVAFLAVALIIGGLSNTVAQASQTISQGFQTNQTGEIARLNLSGQAVCQVTLNQQAAGTVLTAQVSANNGITWQALTTIGNGSMTQTGVYPGAIDSASYPLIRLVAVAVTGSVTGNIVCGDTLPVVLYSGQGGGGGGGFTSAPLGGNCITVLTPPAQGQIGYSCASPTVAPSVAPSNCIGVTTPPAVGQIAYTCNTPNPVFTGLCTSPRPTGVNGMAIDLTTPCPLIPPLPLSTANGGTGTSAPSPQITSTACAGAPSLTGTWPANTITVPAGCGAATPNPLVSTLLARASMKHVWQFNDNPNTCVSNCTPGPCPSTIADSIASGATAVPSPVPLPVATNASGYPQCGAAPLYPGGGTSINFCNGHAAPISGCAAGALDAVLIPLAVFIAPPYTYYCVFDGGNVIAANSTALFSQGGGTELQLFAGAGPVFSVLNNNITSTSLTSVTGKGMFALTNDGTTTTLYVNGSVITAPTAVPSAAATSGTFGAKGSAAAGSTSWNGRMAVCGQDGAAWTQQLAQQIYSLTGL